MGRRTPFEECTILSCIRSLDTVRVSNEVFWRKDGSSFPVEYVAKPQIISLDGPTGKTERAIGAVIAFTRHDGALGAGPDEG